MTNGEGADLEIIVVADAPSGGGGVSEIDHLSLAEKEMCQNLAETLGVGGYVFATAGGVMAFAGPEAVGPAIVAIVAAGAMGITSIGFQHLANDPPQRDYKRPVRVRRLGIHLPARAGDDVAGAQSLLDTCNDLIPFTRGALDAYERSQGATMAGDRRWSVAHGHGAQVLQGCATVRLLQLARRLEQLQNERLDALVLNSTEYDRVQQQARAHNLFGARAEDILLSGGLSQADLATVEDAIAQRPTATLPTGNFQTVLTNLATALRATATQLSLA